MNQAIHDISSFVVSESGAFPSVNEFTKLAAANRRAIEQEMKQKEEAVRPVVRKLLEGKINRVDAVKELRNILHGKIGEEELSEVLRNALSEHPELMVGGKRKTRRGKRRKSKKSTRRATKKSIRRSKRGGRGCAAPPKKSRRSQRGGTYYSVQKLKKLQDEVKELIERATVVVEEAKKGERDDDTLQGWLFGGIANRAGDRVSGNVDKLERMLQAFKGRDGYMERMFDEEIMNNPYEHDVYIDDTQFMNAYFNLKALTDEVERAVGIRKRLAAEQRQWAQERRWAEAEAKAAKEAKKADRAADLKQKREWESSLQARKYHDGLPGDRDPTGHLRPPEPQTWREWAGSFF